MVEEGRKERTGRVMRHQVKTKGTALQYHTSIFTTGLEPLARKPQYLTRQNTLGHLLGAA